jgi:hypothetical protein
LNYTDFLATKTIGGDCLGFEPKFLPDFLFPFQSLLAKWSVVKGRAAILAGCGLGKTPIELVWQDNMVRKTNKPGLLLTPLAVSHQMVREGDKFKIEVRRCPDGKWWKGINAVNYERLSKFNPDDFGSVVCDEASILKSIDGKTRKMVTHFLTRIPYKLLATATPAPNDYMELGSLSEALGIMGRFQMLGMFFTHDSSDTQQWDLKGYAKKAFWKWMCSWARAVRSPSDLGFTDEGFNLPKLITNQHTVGSSLGVVNGQFGDLEAMTLDDQRAERKRTLTERCEKVADLVKDKDYSIVWCHLNLEGDLLEKLIPDCVQVSGADSDDAKEEKLDAFAKGKIKKLVTKPRIGGFGLNLQHCAHQTFFPSHSYEQYHQCVHRCWRFGQKRKVVVDIVTSIRERRVLANMRKKEAAAEEMFRSIVNSMGDYQLQKDSIKNISIKLPEWLTNGR